MAIQGDGDIRNHGDMPADLSSIGLLAILLQTRREPGQQNHGLTFGPGRLSRLGYLDELAQQALQPTDPPSHLIGTQPEG